MLTRDICNARDKAPLGSALLCSALPVTATAAANQLHHQRPNSESYVEWVDRHKGPGTAETASESEKSPSARIHDPSRQFDRVDDQDAPWVWFGDKRSS